MSNYTEQKANLEAQGWRMYQGMGGKSYFGKKDVSGLAVVVDQYTGSAILEIGCPKDLAEKHKPELLKWHGGYREGAGRPSTGRKKQNYYVTDDEDAKIREFLKSLRNSEE